MSRKKFFLKLALVVSLLIGWYIFVYMPQLNKLNTIDMKLLEVKNKVQIAQKAKTNLDNIKDKFSKEQNRLEKERSKFVKKEELGKVTKQLQRLARNYNLKLLDFSPNFQDYFKEKEEQIIPLPISILVEGRYIQVGKFIEKWEQLPFYLIPESIVIQLKDEKATAVQAAITSNLYTWNE